MTTTDDTPREFTLTWTLDASPEVVFRSWTDPARLGWFFNDHQPIPRSRSSSISASAVSGGR